MHFLAFCVSVQGPGFVCMTGTWLLLRLLKLVNSELG